MFILICIFPLLHGKPIFCDFSYFNLYFESLYWCLYLHFYRYLKFVFVFSCESVGCWHLLLFPQSKLTPILDPRPPSVTILIRSWAGLAGYTIPRFDRFHSNCYLGGLSSQISLSFFLVYCAEVFVFIFAISNLWHHAAAGEKVLENFWATVA